MVMTQTYRTLWLQDSQIVAVHEHNTPRPLKGNDPCGTLINRMMCLPETLLARNISIKTITSLPLTGHTGDISIMTTTSHNHWINISVHEMPELTNMLSWYSKRNIMTTTSHNQWINISVHEMPELTHMLSRYSKCNIMTTTSHNQWINISVHEVPELTHMLSWYSNSTATSWQPCRTTNE